MSSRRVTRIISVVSNMPMREVTRTRKVGLLKVGSSLLSGIVNRSGTVTALMGTVREDHMNLGSPGGPVNAFVFLNPANINGARLTGRLTGLVFNSTSTLVHVSVDRCVRGFAMSHLMKTPPKCMNCRRNKRLARGMEHGPCSVILLSRVRGTRPSMFGVLLRIVSRNQLASDCNEAMSFGGAVIVVASGVKAHRLGRFKGKVKFTTRIHASSGRCSHDIVAGTLGGSFTPRFVGHLSRVVAFSRLSLSTLAQVVSVRLGNLCDHIGGVNCGLIVSRSTGGFMTAGNCSMRFKTHPLGHTVRGGLRSNVSRLVLKSRVTTNSAVGMDCSGRGSLVIVAIRGGMGDPGLFGGWRAGYRVSLCLTFFLPVVRRGSSSGMCVAWWLGAVGDVRGKGVKMAARGVFPVVGGFLCDSRRVFLHRLISGTMSTARGLGALTSGNRFGKRVKSLAVGMDLKGSAVAVSSQNVKLATRRVSGCVGRVTFSNTGSFLRGCGSSTGTVVKRFNLNFCSTFVMTGGIRVVAGSRRRKTRTIG